MTEQADALRDEGMRLFENGAYADALDCFQRAHDAYTEAGDTLSAGEMLNNCGVIHRLDQNNEQAAEMFAAARQIFTDAGDRSREAQALGNLAPLLSKQGQIDAAIEAYQEAATAFGKLGDDARRAEVLMALGLLQFREGQRAAGMGTYERGLMLLENPTPKQKRTRALLKMRQRVLGG